MTVRKITMKVSISKWSRLLIPIWLIQVALGFKPWMPKLFIKADVVR